MKTAVLFIAAALAALIAAAGCGAQQADVQTLQRNDLTLRGMIASDQQQVGALQQQVRQLNDRLTEAEHGQMPGANGDDQLKSLGQRVASLESEVHALQAGLATAPGTAPPEAGTPAAPGTTAAAPEGAPAAPEAVAAPTWQAGIDAEIASAKNSSAPGAGDYRAGLDAMKQGKYPLAVVRFAHLQHKYPKSELAEPAEYYSANALFEESKYDQAILEFNDLVMRFPNSRFASSALLREAQAFLKINDRIDARLTLQKLLSDHGNSPEAAAAHDLMKSLVSS